MSEAFKVDSLVEFDDVQSAKNMTELMGIEYYRIEGCDSGKYKIIPCTEWHDCQFRSIAIGDIVYHYFYGKVKIVNIERSNIHHDVDIVVSKKGKEITIKNEEYNNDGDRIIKGISLEKMRITDFFDYLLHLDSDNIRVSKEKCITYLLWVLIPVMVMALVIVSFKTLGIIATLDIKTGIDSIVILSISIIVSVLLVALYIYTLFLDSLLK